MHKQGMIWSDLATEAWGVIPAAHFGFLGGGVGLGSEFPRPYHVAINRELNLLAVPEVNLDEVESNLHAERHAAASVHVVLC